MSIAIGDVFYNIVYVCDIKKFNRFVVIRTQFVFDKNDPYYILKVSNNDDRIWIYKKKDIDNYFISLLEYREIKLKKIKI